VTADAVLVETVDRVLRDASRPEARQEFERLGWSRQTWEAIAALGLPWVGVPEAQGGQGGSLADGLAVLRAVGFHAAAVPVAESGLLGGWLLASAGLPISDRPVTVVPDSSGLRFEGEVLRGTAERVPWARAADRIVVLVDRRLVVAATAGRGMQVVPVANLAGEARDTVIFDAPPVEAVVPASAALTDALRLRGMLTRVALMAGALDAMASLTASYTAERRQFGKPIGSFQAVQALIVRAAEESVLADIALQAATTAAESGPAAFEITAAKVVADDAARAATRAAHQAHGAVGMTREYPLHHLSRRLWSWRAEYGNPQMRATLGRAVARQGADTLYRVVADGSGACPTV
jgi:acyl-CoA dehydrogenase